MPDTVLWPWCGASDPSTERFRPTSTAGAVQQRRGPR
jgi:hypothetical protein